MRSLLIIIPLTVNLGQSFGQEISCNPELNVRTRITETNVPNNYTCYMEMTRGNGERYGTGFLIHPRVILSAGHNFAWYPNGSVTAVKVYFGSIDSSTYLADDTIALKKGANKFFKSGYWSNGKIYRDFSIVVLPDSSVYKKVKGYYKILTTERHRQIDSINITGSPGDTSLFQMWTSGTKNFEVKPDKVIYDLHTEVRNSGSPIWTKIGEEYFVIGIHSREWGKCNAAILLTDEVIKQITSWCKTAGIELQPLE